MSTERRPNFFIVGAQKSGTSAIAGWLQQHPQVFMSFPKEPGYLAFLESGYPFLDGYGRRAPASKWVVDSRDAYARLFSAATDRCTIVGEASTWYFSIPHVAARIKAYSPDARILVILRNPADRAYSAWCHARRDDLEPCSRFAEALAKEEERGEVEFLLRYHRMGLYSRALAEYRSVFAPSRMRVLLYEDLRSETRSLWNLLCDFLAIDRLDEPPPQRRLNRSGDPRSRALQEVLKSQRVRRFAKAILPVERAMLVKEWLDRVNLQKFPPLRHEERGRLQAYYRDDIRALADLTDRDLRGWLK